MNYRIIYLRARPETPEVKKGFPIACVATSVDHTNGNINYQVTAKDPQDVFDRKLARQLALGRLVEKPIMVDNPDNVSNTHDITFMVMKDIASRIELPSRAVKAARRWCKNSEFQKVKNGGELVSPASNIFGGEF